MNFKKFWKSLSEEERDTFCKLVGNSKDTVRNNYLSPNPHRRGRPSNRRLALMIIHSDYQLTVESLLDYFSAEALRRLVVEVEKGGPVAGA